MCFSDILCLEVKGMFDGLKKMLGLDANDRALKRYSQIVNEVNDLEESIAILSDEDLVREINYIRKNVSENGQPLDEVMCRVFAIVREAARRSLGMRHFDVQIMGAIALHEGKIAEMKTGEGKTLVATMPVVLNALEGKGVHVVTVNDYLAKRDAEWMGKVYRFLGLSVGVINPFMSAEERRKAYEADVTYGTNSEFGFDYLRDNMAISPQQLVQRGHHYAIVDEVDSILIDEARTPLIISGPSEDSIEPYKIADKIARSLTLNEDFELDEKEKNVALTEAGIRHCEKILGIDDIYAEVETSELLHKIVQALKARYLFKKDVHYVVKDGEVIIVDEFTGRLMYGRRYSDGLHQAIEAKEGVRIGRENQTLATITLQNYFRMYHKLAGMTGTAATEAEEFKEIYGLEVVVIPTHKPMIRQDMPDVIYKTKREKFAAVADEIKECYERRQPVLVGTTSIENSEKLSKLLAARRIPHQVLNAKYHEKEAKIIAQAGRIGAVTVATNMAGRGTDILLGGNPEFLALEEAQKRGIDVESDKEAYGNLLEEFKKLCEEEHEKVVALGGLHVIGTERHESRRIDNQLRGRSGRQGDPGSSRFYLSLEDDLLRLFGSDKIQGIMEKLGMKEGEAIDHPLLSRAIESAQKKVEQYHFDIRKQLLQYDSVMNQQRMAIYDERKRILLSDDLIEHTWQIITDALDGVLEEHFPDEGEADPNGAIIKIKTLFSGRIAECLSGVDDRALLPEARDKMIALLKEEFDAKVEELGLELANNIFKMILLRVLDAHWKEHLLAMDELRRGIGLRALGQKDPLLEYQFESYNLFQQMLGSIREGVARLALKVSVAHEEKRPMPVTLSRDLVMAGAARASHSNDRANIDTAKKVQKVGRNDPCPCGSGKKYKYCCGRNA
ncbi:protein translocase subunit secA [Acetomicrobium flavidum]|uniref:Protein translocase subunit SecA n=2 Tax=Acetomicrobium flavidum TaxID=49896 RepID=A0ABY1JCA3_9BACT|nr:protein translocase subunit secA [Acetomicrobium flavidum]